MEERSVSSTESREGLRATATSKKNTRRQVNTRQDLQTGKRGRSVESMCFELPHPLTGTDVLTSLIPSP